MTSSSTFKLLALASTLACAGGAWAADYTWKQNETGSYDITSLANWDITEGLPTGVLPCKTNTVAFTSGMTGDITLTASSDLDVKRFTFSESTKDLNLVLDLGTNDAGEPRIWQSFYTGDTMGNSTMLQASNLTIRSGRYIVTNGMFHLNHSAGGQVVVEGANTIIQSGHGNPWNNGAFLNLSKGDNKTMIVRGGAQIKGSFGSSGRDGAGANRFVCFTGEGTRFDGKSFVIARGSNQKSSLCVIESNAVINATTVHAQQHTTGKNNKFIVRDFGEVIATDFYCSGEDNCVEVSNATVKVTGTCTPSGAGNVNINVRDKGLLTAKEILLENGGQVNVYKGGTCVAKSLIFSYRRNKTKNLFCCVDGGNLLVTNIFLVGFTSNLDGKHYGHTFVAQNGASVIVSNKVGETFLRNFSVGGSSSACSLVISNKSSFVLRGNGGSTNKGNFEIGCNINNDSKEISSNTCVRVHQSLLECEQEILFSGYQTQAIFDDAIVTGKTLKIGYLTKDYASNNVMRVSGADTAIYAKESAAIQNYSTLVFDIPQTGFKQVPFVSGGTITIDASTKVEIEGKAYQKLSGAPVALMTAEKGFASLELGEETNGKYYVNLPVTLNGEAVNDAQLYVRKDGTKETLYAKLPVLGGTVIIVR